MEIIEEVQNVGEVQNVEEVKQKRGRPAGSKNKDIPKFKLYVDDRLVLLCSTLYDVAEALGISYDSSYRILHNQYKNKRTDKINLSRYRVEHI